MPKDQRSFILAHAAPEGETHVTRLSAPDEDGARTKLLAVHSGHAILDVQEDDGRTHHAIGGAMHEVKELDAKAN